MPPLKRNQKWQFWVDRGGTFTDVIAQNPAGEILTHKLLSENPQHYPDACLQGIRDLMGISSSQPIPGSEIESVKMGTTVATNALLERKGEPTLLCITKGFGDALRIGYQNRPDIFARNIVLPTPLYQSVLEIDQRMDAKGNVLREADMNLIRSELQSHHDAGIRSVAIVLMHGWRCNEHELLLKGAAQSVGFLRISLSSEVSPVMKLIPRSDTTVVDAYLSPILHSYIERVSSQLRNVRLLFMQSNGGLAEAEHFHGKDSILSGPAGGVVGMVRTALQARIRRVIGFDMGGTSTDVSHYDGEWERVSEKEVAGVRVRAPMMRINTVAAGGGSILAFDGAKYRVGPESAGADPGPACYRKGGVLTVTDANLMLGKLVPEFFPKVFGSEGNLPLDTEVVKEQFQAMAHEIRSATGDQLSPETVAEGFLKIAVEKMALVIKEISVARGYDVTEYALCGFGGAGGQHVCLVAEALGIKKVFLHPHAGVLSALGIGLADTRVINECSVEKTLAAQLMEELEGALEGLRQKGVGQIHCPADGKVEVETKNFLHLKYEGTDTALKVPFGSLESICTRFEELHRQYFGFLMPDRPMVVETVGTEVVGKSPLDGNFAIPWLENNSCVESQENQRVHMFIHGKWRDVPLYLREGLPPGAEITGPAIICEKNGTIVLEPGWTGTILERGEVVLERALLPEREPSLGTQCDPVMLEVFNNLFMSIAEQMGHSLEKTACSTNIKERLDFSCALFDQAGDLIANAPHIPVHLGAMGESVKSVLRDRGSSIKPGNIYVTNNPYNGGTHLPDVTVVTPVFDDSGKKILFFTASRGHHADIGGITPGSMPPHSTHIDEEGVLFDNQMLVKEGRFQEGEIRRILMSGPHPARNPAQNLTDLKAQVAANERGGLELRKMVEHYGLQTVKAYMGHVKKNAEWAVRKVLGRLSDGEFTDYLDDGTVIKVRVSVDHSVSKVVVDFTGTSPQVPGNLNAPLAVAHAAVLYVFRTLVDDTIPLNAGCMAPLEIIVPHGCFLNPHYPAAVVGGNVETSMRIVDTLYGALKTMAAGQGTMNNLTFGNEKVQYYETIAGGAGAGPGFGGQSAVHTHMTNTRITDPEVLEWRYPVLLEEFSIRRDSGGRGRFPGGDGIRRRLKFLEKMDVGLLSERRVYAPYGMEAGNPGAKGRNLLIKKENGTIRELPGKFSITVEEGDSLTIETPGGGGYGGGDL